MTYLCFDCGLYCNLASALSDNGKNRVLYYTPYGSKYPKYEEYAPGDNFEFLEKVKYPFDYIDKADAIVNFDCSNQDLINYLRLKYPEKSIFGSGLGARLEDDRLSFKKWLGLLNLPVVQFKVVKGMTALREYLKTNPKKIIKVNIFRGDFETLRADSFDAVDQVLKDRQPSLGMIAESMEFIVEDMVESKAEIGFDGFFNGSEYIPFAFGYECAKNLYIGKVGEDIPDPLMETLEAFKPLYTKMNYRGAISTEELIISKDKHFFIDPCQRVALPLGVLYSRFIKNWSEVVHNIGLGESVDIQCDHKYVGAFALSTRNAKDHFTLINIDKNKRDNFRFMMACQDEKKNYYAVKGCEEVVVVVAGGETVDEVIDQLKTNAQAVNAYGLEIDDIKGIDDVKEKIALGKTVGIDF